MHSRVFVACATLTLVGAALPAPAHASSTGDNRIALDLPVVRLVPAVASVGGDYVLEIDDGTVIDELVAGPNNTAAFRVYRPDGSVHEYGVTNDSREERFDRSPGTVTHHTTIARLNRFHDRDGLGASYEYDYTRPGTGAPTSP